jgi:hypothetical protein
MAETALSTVIADTHACRDCNRILPLSAFYVRERGTHWVCRECHAARMLSRHYAKRDQLVAEMKERYQKNKGRHREYMIDYRQKNADELAAKKKAYADANKPAQAKRMSRWKAENRQRVAAHESARRASKMGSVAAWCDHAEVDAIYALAIQMRGEGKQVAVDHVVPITPPKAQSLDGNFQPKSRFVGPLIPLVQGLQCHTNLAIIDRFKNISKHNKHWPDMPIYERL